MLAADEDLFAATVDGESRGNDHLSDRILFLTDVEPADDTPAEDHPVDEPALLVEVALLGEEIPDCHHLAIEVIIPLEIGNLTDTTALFCSSFISFSVAFI